MKKKTKNKTNSKKTSKRVSTRTTGTVKSAKLTNKFPALPDVQHPFNVYSECEPLTEVLLHVPGRETEALHCDFVIDNDVHASKIKHEYDALVKLLKQQNIQVNYLTDVIAKALDELTSQEFDQFIEQYIYHSGLIDPTAFQTCFNYLRSFNSNQAVAKALIHGVRTDDVAQASSTKFTDLRVGKPAYFVQPLSNMIYLRELLLTVGNGLMNFGLINTKNKLTALLFNLIAKYNPRFLKTKNFIQHAHEGCNLTGKNFLALTNETLIIQINEHNENYCVQEIVKNLFNEPKNTIKRAIVIFSNNAKTKNLTQCFMMIDRDKFLINKSFLETNLIYELVPTIDKTTNLVKYLTHKQLKLTLSEVIELLTKKRPKFIVCGGADESYELKEFNTFAANVLVLSPSEVVAFDVNEKTNELLKNLNVTVHQIPATELSKMAGGIADMVVPIRRKKVF